METYEPTWSGIEKDIENYLEKYGVHDTLDGAPVIRGYDKAQRYILDQYYQKQMYDALITYFIPWNWEGGNGKLLLELSDVLVQKSDVRRLKRLWYSVIAKQKLHFWKLHAISKVPANISKAKEIILGTLKKVQAIMSQLGEEQEAERLNSDIARIEREERGKTLPEPLNRTMDQICFWETIGEVKRKAASTPEQIELLIAELEMFKATEIARFEKLLQQKMAELYHWDVWAVAYLAQRGCSDDAFEAFRAWLILQGQDVYRLALNEVAQLSKYVPLGQETQAEGLLFAAVTAYENRAGKPMRPTKPKILKLQGTMWEEGDLKDRYPELYKYYRY